MRKDRRCEIMAYIDRDKLLKDLNEAPAYIESEDVNFGILIAIGEVNNQPTADVQEVVRCKDCICYEEIDYYHPIENATKKFCRLYKRQMHDNDFCSYGKRKEPIYCEDKKKHIRHCEDCYEECKGG